MRLDPMPGIPGLTVTARDADSMELAVAREIPADSFRRLLAWLPVGSQLDFYDQYYPSMSDPGAYVSVQSNGELFAYHLANHGWSSDWLKQSPELIAAWLALNLTARHADSETLTRITIRKAVAPLRRPGG